MPQKRRAHAFYQKELDMYHDYYDYSAEKLLEAPKIPLKVLENDELVYRALADEMIALTNSRDRPLYIQIQIKQITIGHI